ncbi:adenylate/guanylate cyclase domain-containing protein [Acinetobacter wuhouensis]|uniref:Adenylate/guanylate cyclase domain-containing protein n=1 Tax=Acinetobacter wuhouensis TaxID=1879050 RepID=A0A385C3K3_9GAMM|nr:MULTISPECIES: adenylate/guanylate cyclase domain-containing protein [Acinetobacter]AXQ22291.1 adenylate/guanylate cyclase domain-containing protein [Acinetobacter wuhouensis]AYO54490.1 adenylate/guanylate cyclase domain-containing protein [Acinetobacter wuhouensis]RZG43942.1 adenylate/guanylate cyclase domain-containing protein [Acinetobacter wuhouensis]RZG69462.1 adenylate/guanylate cyclase domain-containing protein [Acinetobacter wuhouensis]RZG75123.1 adenylate/guanylate cyclase domain-co
MPFERMLDKEPKQFEILQRIMGYLIIALIVIVYYFTSPVATYQIYVPFFIGFIFLISPKLSHWLEYKYGAKLRKNVYFLIDVIVVSIALAAVHLSLVVTFIMLFAILYTALNNKISFMMGSLAVLIAFVVFYTNIIFIFGFEDYFQQTSPELTVLSFVSIILFINIGNYYQSRRIKSVEKQKNTYFNEMNRYIELSNQLSRYAPLQLWQAIMRGETEAKIEYKRKKITVFFSDIQGFTELSETLIPDDLAFVLNDYLSHMTEIAKQYGATVDKFMGDAILIFFGDPDSQGVEQDAKNCIDMAIAMRQQMKFLRERWIKMGYAPLHIRMGISTGYCHVGNYGAVHRMAYTIVGRDANLAARLQSAAEIDEILVSDETYKLVKNDYLCAPKSPIELKGIQGKVRTWQVMEKYSASKNENQQWFDYEYKGFHLVLNLEEVQNFEYSELVEVLEKMVARIKVQQKLTNAHGVARLNAEDEVKTTYTSH